MTISSVPLPRGFAWWLRRGAPASPIAGSAMTATGVRRARVGVVAVVYLALVAIAHYAALWVRFDGAVPSGVIDDYLYVLPWLLGASAVTLLPFRVYQSVWRYTSIFDLRDLVAAMSVNAVVLYVVVHAGLGRSGYPRSTFLVGAVFSIVSIGGVRLAWRLAHERIAPAGGKRILIIGAGDAGEMIARDLMRRGNVIVGFVDDAPAKKGQLIHRVPVLGGREDLPRILALTAPNEVLIALPSAGPTTIRKFLSALGPFKVPITTLPSPREIVNGKVSAAEVRKISVEDLLPRLPVHLDNERARELVEGRRVMVTGAGGSIGSELCRQLAALDPDRLILYERYENNLYSVLNTIPRSFRIKAAIGDVTDRRRLHAVLREHRPHVLFHAAAHKHVPLMEVNPCEAVKNNVIGTRMAAEAAAEFGVETFMLISTDKAVNPTSLMGATKRAAELVVQALATGAGPRSAIVRFGNVLGSNGSVIPRWQEQIAAGGPVTVTHPDVERYFMLIPEAVQLILQAAAVARGGEIFALEMGEQINLLAMARELIRLSGFVPDEEIPIVFTGLRPGEKLSEELVGPGEEHEGAPVDKVLQLRVHEPADPAILLATVTALSTLAIRGDVSAVIDALCAIVPTFRPGPLLSGQARGRALVTTRTADRLRARAVRAKAIARTASRPMLLRGLAPKDAKPDNPSHADGTHGAGHRQN